MHARAQRGRRPQAGRWSHGLVGLGLVGALSSCGGERTFPDSDVLFITIDTLRADHMGCYGYGVDTTPALDQLAAEGVRFEQSYSMAPFTAPSHASLFTGMHPVSHGVVEWVSLLDPGAITMAERYGGEGYATAAFYNHPSLEPTGTLRGFDHVEKRYFEEAEPTLAAYQAWLEAQDGPSAAWVHLWDVHRPYGFRDWQWWVEWGGPQREPLAFAEDTYGQALRPPIGRDEGWYNLNAENPRRAQMGPAVQQRMLERYDGGVRYADRALGSLFDELRSSGRLDEMIIVVTSDHGETLTERGGCWYTHDPFLHEETLRVPLIMRLPGAWCGGTVVSDTLARGIDVLPTLLSLSGLEQGYGIQGRDLMPAVRGKVLPASPLWAETRTRSAKERHERVDPKLEPARFLEHREVVSDGQDKLIVDIETGEQFFYDLERDPLELTNEYDNPFYLQRRNRLRSTLTELRNTVPRARITVRGASEAENQLLDDLGYGAGADSDDEDS